MKGQVFKKILKLFDYFKKAYLLNINNKTLYKPQIYFILLKGALVLITALFSTMVVESFLESIETTSNVYNFSFLWVLILIVFPVVITILVLASSYVEAGMYYMYLKVSKNTLEPDDWKIGAKQFFTRFLGGNLLILLFWIIALIPYLLVGVISLGIGFTLVPVIISALLMVWKVIVVSENASTVPAIKKSLAFGKMNLIPASVLIIIQNSLTTIGGGSVGGGYSNLINLFNQSNYRNTLGEAPLNPGTGNFDFDLVNLFRTIAIIVSSILTVSVIVGALIQMLFTVFFGLTFTIIYHDNWQIDPEEAIQLNHGEVL